ncbi:C-C chemokine receptor type 1-like [Haliotis rufescens]|uniref:C-C chemokine receptor type 1-like n=1 Tax=Haliotis rufescens TaxID=6454 RepID=UPI00201EEC80|nr:C-C chemokine receptor type 1-like [Haliotis rufescens]
MTTTADATITSAPTEDYTQYPEYKASRLVWSIFPPILIFFGTIGNMMSIVVLNRKPMRESTVSIYLTALSVMDMLVLYTGLMRQWLRVVIELDVRVISEMSCKIHIWLVYFTLDMSVWLLVSVTIERCVSVMFPYTVKQYYTRCTALVNIAVIAVLLLALNSHYLYGLGDVQTTTDGERTIERCVSLWNGYEQFEFQVWPWIDLCVFSLIPLIVLIIANISIIQKILTRRRNARRINPVVSTITSEQKRYQDKKTSSMTIMLLVLNLVFFVCTTPISVYLIGEPYWLDDLTPRQEAVLSLVWAIANMLQYTNNSINFLLYCISGSRFRNTLKDLFQRRNRVRPSNSMTMLRNSQREAGASGNGGGGNMCNGGNENGTSPNTLHV